MNKEIKIYLDDNDLTILSQAADILQTLKDMNILSGLPTLNDIYELGNVGNYEHSVFKDNDHSFYCPVLENIRVKNHSIYHKGEKTE